MDSSDEEETKSEPDSALQLDAAGVPVAHKHGSQAASPVWTFVHKLSAPIYHKRKMHTHVCTLCSSSIATRSGTPDSWKMALVITSNTSNAVKHMLAHHKDHDFTISILKAQQETNLKRAAKHDAQEEPLAQRRKQQTIPASIKKATDDAILVKTSRWLIANGTLCKPSTAPY
jgi:hypothetical protein